jgi:hypothetical protein
MFFKLPESYRRPILASEHVRAASGFEFFPVFTVIRATRYRRMVSMRTSSKASGQIGA